MGRTPLSLANKIFFLMHFGKLYIHGRRTKITCRNRKWQACFPRGWPVNPGSCAAAIVKAPKRCPFWITIRRELLNVKTVGGGAVWRKRGPYWWKKSGDHHLGCRKPCKILRPNYQPLVNAGFLVAINNMLVWFRLIWQVHVITYSRTRRWRKFQKGKNI